MDFKVMIPIFSSVFMAELGDKTQVATVCFIAGGGCSKMEVFLASSLALILSSFLAVVFGEAVGRFVPPHYLKIGAGAIFVLMGLVFMRQGLGKDGGEEAGHEN